jgi:hypothetical protein
VASRWLGGSRNSSLIVAGNGSKLAATGLQGLLDVAIFSPGEGRSPGDRGGTSGSHQAHIHGKMLCGAKNASKPSWQGWVQGFRQNRGEVYARPAQPGPKPRLAKVPKAPRTGRLGLRFFLCPNGPVPNA